MLSERLRPIIDPATAAVGRALAKARLTPDAVTVAGLALTAFSAWLIGRGDLVTAGIVLIPAQILDVLDGAVARATGTVSRWGGFFDSVADRVGDGALMAGVIWYARSEDDRLLAAALIVLVVGFLVPYARAKAEGYGYPVHSGPGERAERAVILIVGLILGFLEAAVWLIAALATWTFAGRVLAVRKASRAG